MRLNADGLCADSVDYARLVKVEDLGELFGPGSGVFGVRVFTDRTKDFRLVSDRPGYFGELRKLVRRMKQDSRVYVDVCAECCWMSAPRLT